MASNKRLIAAGAAAGGAGAFDPLQNFETVTYTGNGGTQKITGYIRKGAAFKDYTSYIQTTLPSSSIYAISFWMYFESGVTSYTPFGTDVSSGAGDIVTEVGTNGSFSITVQNKLRSLSAGALGSTGWKHIAYSSDQTLYINGVNQTGGTTTTNSNPSANLLIGGWNYPPPTWGGFNSKLDQIRVFNRNLTTGEVTTLYGETYASSTKSTTDIFGDGSGVALYELDEDANDTGGVSGKFDGSSAHFNGTDSSVGNNSIDTATTKAVSIWVNAADFSERWPFQQGDGQGIENFIRFYNTDDIQVRWGNVTQTFSGYSANTWYHIVAQTDAAGNANVWINGTEVGTSTAPSTLTEDSTNIGRRKNGATWQYYFKGLIDDVRIYSDTLTDAEIGYLYNNTTASIPTDNLTAYYKFNGDATDETTNHDGTESNVTYGYNGTPTNVNFLGMAFQPDLVWTKTRSQPFNHSIYDSVRGVNKLLQSNTTIAEFPATNALNSFDSNGFTLGANDNSNTNGESSVAWCWKAGGAAVTDSSTGTLTANISANTAAGFSIVNYTGNQTSGATFPHGLDSAAEMVIIKNKSASTYWFVYHKDLDTNKNVYLNTSDSQQADNQMFGADADVVTVGSSISVNSSTTDSMIAYCFHSVDGYQKIGSYTGGTGEVDVTTGFKPRWVMIKNASQAADWVIFDTIRSGTTNPINDVLEANTSDQEVAVGTAHIDIVDNGFQLNNTTSFSTNSNGDTYIYLAIA